MFYIGRKRRGINERFVRKRPSFVTVALLGAFLLTAATCPGEAVSSGSLSEPPPEAIYLDVLEGVVDAYEPLWTEDFAAPRAGFFDFRRYGNWRDEPYATIIMVPGNGMVVLSYAVLLKETNKQSFGRRGISRQQLLDHAVKAIRWCCLTSAYVDHPIPYLPNTRPDLAFGRQWKRNYGWRGDLLGYLTIGAALIRDDLDEQTWSLVRKVLCGAALRERIVRSYERPEGGNHDQVKQDFSSTVGAAYLFPDDTRHADFMKVVTACGIDMVSRPLDRTSETQVEGQSVRQWARGWNIYDDGSSDHHGRASVWYGGEKLFEAQAYLEILACLTGARAPRTWRYPDNGFDAAYRWIKVLSLDNGAVMHPHGVEYDSYHGEGLLAFCYGGLLRGDPQGRYLEAQAARLLQRHESTVGQYDYHRGTAAKAALAYLLHKYTDRGRAAVEPAQALIELDGVFQYPSQQVLVHRAPGKWVSFSWGSLTAPLHRPMALVSPSDRPEPLIYCHPLSLAGRALCYVPWWVCLLTAVAVLLTAGALMWRLSVGGVAPGPILLCLAACSGGGGVLAWLFHTPLSPDALWNLADLPWWAAHWLAMAGAVAALVYALVQARPGRRASARWALAVAMPLAVLDSVLLHGWRQVQFLGQGQGDWMPPSMAAAGPWLAVAVILLLGGPLSGTFMRRAAGLLAATILLSACVVMGIRGLNAAAPLTVNIRGGFVLAAALGSASALLWLIGLVLASRRPLSPLLCALLALPLGTAAVVMLYASPFETGGLTISAAREEYRQSVRRDGFSTAGCVTEEPQRRFYGFFTFDDGPAVMLFALQSDRAADVRYSGLPVFLFRRAGLAGPHLCAFEGGQAQAAALGPTKSSWLSLPDLAMVLPHLGTFRGYECVGFNWARSPDYRDRCEMIALDPCARRSVGRDRLAVDQAVAIYPNVSADDAARLAERMTDLSGILPAGWRGVVAPCVTEGRRVLSLARLWGDRLSARLQLRFPEGAPVCLGRSTIGPDGTRLDVTLETYDSVGQTLDLYLDVASGGVIDVWRPAPDRLEIRSPAPGPTGLTLRYRGPRLAGARLSDRGREDTRTLDIEAIQSPQGLKLDFTGQAAIQLDRAQKN